MFSTHASYLKKQFSSETIEMLRETIKTLHIGKHLSAQYVEIMLASVESMTAKVYSSGRLACHGNDYKPQSSMGIRELFSQQHRLSQTIAGRGQHKCVGINVANRKCQ